MIRGGDGGRGGFHILNRIWTSSRCSSYDFDKVVVCECKTLGCLCSRRANVRSQTSDYLICIISLQKKRRGGERESRKPLTFIPFRALCLARKHTCRGATSSGRIPQPGNQRIEIPTPNLTRLTVNSSTLCLRECTFGSGPKAVRPTSATARALTPSHFPLILILMHACFSNLGHKNKFRCP